MKLAKVVKVLSELSQKQLQSVADGLVWFDESQAERLKNSISVAQEERDLRYLEFQKQHEFMDRSADLDSQFYGERV